MRVHCFSLLACLLVWLSVGSAQAQSITVQSISLSPTSLVGGATSTATVQLSGVPTVDTYVYTESSNPALTGLPNTIFVAANSSATLTFPVATKIVSSTQLVKISAVTSLPSQSVWITLNPGSAQAFSPTQDAYVQSGTNANNTYGTLDPTNLIAKRDGIPSNVCRAAYLKFDLSGVHNPVATAALQMTLVQNSNLGVINVSCYGASDNYAGGSTAWTEGGLTANNAPSLDLSTFLHSPAETPINMQPVTWNAGATTFDVTSYVNAHLG